MNETADKQLLAMEASLREKTGRSIDDWAKLAAGLGEDKHGALVKRLKDEHGLTHGYANLVAHRARADQGSDTAPVDLVSAQYSGKKAALRPLYDALIAEITGFGDDLEIAPKKAYVSLRRKKQFALIQPSTATRLDIGLNLKGVDPAGRLEASGSFNAMVSHRVRLGLDETVDAELAGWLRKAYDAAG
jgi:hypothetical protein